MWTASGGEGKKGTTGRIVFRELETSQSPGGGSHEQTVVRFLHQYSPAERSEIVLSWEPETRKGAPIL